MESVCSFAVLFASANCTIFFFFNDTAPSEIYTLSLHDALPISRRHAITAASKTPKATEPRSEVICAVPIAVRDRKSTRLNSSHPSISYAVFCLKKKKNKTHHIYRRNNTKNHNH